MKSLKEHIFFKIIGFSLGLLLLLPTAIKFTHAFNHYKHEVCNGQKTEHLHRLDLDCKFYDFKLTHNFILTTFNFNVFVPRPVHIEPTSQYVFLSAYQQLHFSLRGPPTRV